MSDNSHDSNEQTQPLNPVLTEEGDGRSNSDTASGGSWLERFLNSFFQEKNIRWLLLIGAAIIFASSLMLVTRAWPEWSATMRAFTVLAYTASLFVAGQFCRMRLQLNLTYQVLYGLTVLLIPVSFLSLSWLSSGTAVQLDVLRSALIAPFLVGTVFLWFASKTIFDHVLRTRQTTFLISYCLLCMAGALPELTSPAMAFAFFMVAWAVMTVGVLKVNRHVFQLTLQHQMPRIFGFLPIALLGTLFIVLTGVLAIPALPIHWMGFGCVMLASTILFTAKSLMDVFQQRTGDLVRPFPWSVSAPLMVGLCLTVVGVALSFSGFSYVSASTFAVVPTALIAAGLMMRVGIQIRHSLFTWFALIFVTIAYQSCPVLFSDLVQMMKETTAAAIRRERVPVSMYGLTYVPLLLGLAVLIRQLQVKSLSGSARPVQQFLMILNFSLIALSFQDVVSAFFVAAVNIALFACYGLILRERRFGYLSILSAVVCLGFAIPALNNMQYSQVSLHWIAPLLSAVAVSLTISSWPDRVLGKVNFSKSLRGNLFGWTSENGRVSAASLPVLQTFGSMLAVVLAGHWMVIAAVDVFEPLMLSAMIQFGCLMVALIFFTLRNPCYLTGLCCNGLCLFVAVRWGIGERLSVSFLLDVSSALSLGICFVTGFLLKQMRGKGFLKKRMKLNRIIGFSDETNHQQMEQNEHSDSNRGWRSRGQAFVVPCFDLSFWTLGSLAAFVHFPALLLLNLPAQTVVVVSNFLTLWMTPVVLLAFIGMALFGRDRKAGVIVVGCLPLMMTAYLPLFDVSLTLSLRLWIWLTSTTAIFLLACAASVRSQHKADFATLQNASWWICTGLLAVSCVAESAALSATALLVSFLLSLHAGFRIHLGQRTAIAILGNLHAVIATVATVHLIQPDLADGVGSGIVFAMCGASMLIFQWLGKSLNPQGCRAWIGVLLSTMVVLFGSFCLTEQSVLVASLVLLGLLLVGTYELREAFAKQSRIHVHVTYVILFLTGFFAWGQVPELLHSTACAYLMLVISVVLLVVERRVKDESGVAVFRKDLIFLARIFPAVIGLVLVGRSFSGPSLVPSADRSFILMMCAGIYGYLFQREQRPRFAILGLILLNLSLDVLWTSLSWTSIEFYMVPAGFSVLGFARVLRDDLPESGRKALQYVGSLMILLSPVLQVLGGSWQHMLLLLILSVMMIVLAIGLRVRSLVYCGTGFLVVDLLAMVVQSTMDSPTLLWAVGILMGVGIMALAAYCERHREQLLSRIRMLSSELAAWD